jgi:hypothetical protein
MADAATTSGAATPARKGFELPDGYESEAEFIAEAVERFQQGSDADRENREQGLEDLRFLAGEQWEKAALDARAGRPCLTINVMPQQVAQVVGDIRLNRPAIKAQPVEDADKDLAEVREGMIRSIERDNDAVSTYISTGENQVACGIGNFRIGLKYAAVNSFNREITLEEIPNPFQVVWDPQSTEKTGKDARWVFEDEIVPRKQFERAYKDEISSGLEVPINDPNNWYTGDTVRVTRYWLMCWKKVRIALLPGGEVCKIEDIPPGMTPVQERDSLEPYARMYLITGKGILDGPFDLPIDRVPILRATGWVVNVGPRRVRFGIIRWAKDPQRLKNYWRSVSAEMLALAPKAKWLIHEAQQGSQQAFRDAHANDDTVLTWSGAQKPELIPPPAINAAVLNEAAMNAQDIKDVTGLHDASLGIKSNESSGVAIQARQREGDVANYIYADNLSSTIREAGRIIDTLIPVVYDTIRQVRVLGEDDKAKVIKVNDPSDPEAVDLNRGRFDISIETGPSFTTKRAEAAQAMTEFVRSVPAVGQVASDLIVRAQGWPGADQIADRLNKALPANLRDNDEDGNPTPPTPQEQQAMQAQQQAQQHAQALAQVELAQAQADQRKAEADAIQAEAEALMAQFKAGLILGSQGAVGDAEAQMLTDFEQRLSDLKQRGLALLQDAGGQAGGYVEEPDDPTQPDEQDPPMSFGQAAGAPGQSAMPEGLAAPQSGPVNPQ